MGGVRVVKSGFLSGLALWVVCAQCNSLTWSARLPRESLQTSNSTPTLTPMLVSGVRRAQELMCVQHKSRSAIQRPRVVNQVGTNSSVKQSSMAECNTTTSSGKRSRSLHRITMINQVEQISIKKSENAKNTYFWHLVEQSQHRVEIIVLR